MAHGNIKTQENGKPRGRGSIGLPTNQFVAIVLATIFLTVGISLAVDFEPPADTSERESADTPASSQWISERSLEASPNPAYVGEEVTFWANASSFGGESLIFTIYYDSMLPGDPANIPNPDSPLSVNYTDNPGSVVQKFTYNSLGNFTRPEDGMSYCWVKLCVYDGTGDPTNELYNSTYYYRMLIRLNTPPVFGHRLGDVSADADEVVNMSVSVYDLDNDPVDILWEFGDGTSATNATNGSYEDRYVNQTHVWSPVVEPGTGDYTVTYTLNITATDTFGNNVTEISTISIAVPANVFPKLALTVSSTKVEPGGLVTFMANATDVEGDPLTWTFDYADNTTDVVHTDETEPGTLVWCNVTHAFNEVGNYTVRLNVSDALGDNQVWPHNRSKTVTIVVAVNRLPSVKESIDYTPGSLIINATIGYLDVYLSIEAIDHDGDVLTVSWYLDDSVDPVLNESAGGKTMYEFVQVLTMTEPRSYNVSVVVTDGREGHNVTVSRTLNATSDNMPPNLKWDYTYASGSHAYPNEEIEFTLVVSDREYDVIEVVIDFGDDTPVIHVNLTEYNGLNITYTCTHAYQYPGHYEVVLWYSDNQIGIFQESHSRTLTATINVQEEYIEQVVIWDWWDYTSLGAVFAIPLLVTARMYLLKRRRAGLEREGMTLEEAQMKSDEMLLQRLIEGGEGGS